jgi:hypothetical protein
MTSRFAGWGWLPLGKMALNDVLQISVIDLIGRECFPQAPHGCFSV